MRSRTRPVAALAAYVALAAQLFGLVHVLVVRHATCPSHGETVHGGAAAQALSPIATSAIESAPVDGRNAGDEHCAVIALLSGAMAGLSPDGGARIAPPADRPLAPPAALDVAAAPLPLLSLAPKT